MKLVWHISKGKKSWTADLPDGSYLVLVRQYEGWGAFHNTAASVTTRLATWPKNFTKKVGQRLLEEWAGEHYPLHALAALSEGLE